MIKILISEKLISNFGKSFWQNKKLRQDMDLCTKQKLFATPTTIIAYAERLNHTPPFSLRYNMVNHQKVKIS